MQEAIKGRLSEMRDVSEISAAQREYTPPRRPIFELPPRLVDQPEPTVRDVAFRTFFKCGHQFLEAVWRHRVVTCRYIDISPDGPPYTIIPAIIYSQGGRREIYLYSDK